MQDKKNLIWIDLEMTGLDCDHDEIIEIATIITDSELNEIAQGPVLAIHQPNHVLEGMDDWNTKQHTASGLVQRVRGSAYTVAEAERVTLNFVKTYVPEKCSPMCGNSICQDRRFLHRLMPELEAYFHYRHIDVSTLKELASRWKPELLKGYTKKNLHLALDDIRESIQELDFYRKNFIMET